MTKVIEVENVSFGYTRDMILEHVDFTVEKGDFAVVIGDNGVGKSTTLKSIMGLVKTGPETSLLFDGKEIAGLPAYERVRRGIGYVPQGRDIFPQMTVLENLELGVQPKLGRGEKVGKNKIPEYLYDLFPILPKFAKRRGGDLSGGQQQQLAIARALVQDPKILILDEPTEGIQPSIINDIGRAIRKINEWKGITVLLVEQYLDFVMENSHYINIMEKGNIIFHKETSLCEKAEVQKLMTD